MKNLFYIVTIILLFIFISCSNNEKSVIESSNLNSMVSIKAIIEDSILNEKRRIEDSIKLEDRKAFLKDSLEKDSINKFDLNSQNSNYKYKVPSLLNNLKNIESRKDDIFGDWGIAIENIYPVGWSKDGKFAYATDSDWGGECGELCYGLDIHILDLYNNKEDTVVWFHSDGADLSPEKRDDINSMWNKENIAIDEILLKFNIEQFNSFELDTSKENFEQFKNYTVSDYVIVFDEGVCGIIKNPFNNLDAIIRYEFIEGWEASPPDNLNYYLFSDTIRH